MRDHLPVISAMANSPASPFRRAMIALSWLAFSLAACLAFLAYRTSTPEASRTAAPRVPAPDMGQMTVARMETTEEESEELRKEPPASDRAFPSQAPASEEPDPMESAGIGSATLSWMPPTQTLDGSPLQSLASYRIDYGKDPAVLERTIEIINPGITRYVVEGLTPGTWYFRITAFDTRGDQSLATPIGVKVID
jgi:Fibronectin type III domain